MRTKNNVLKAFRLFLIWYAIAIIIVALLILIIVLINEFGNDSKVSVWLEIMQSLFKNSPTYFILCIPYILFIIARSIIRDYRKHKSLGLLKGLGLKIILPVLLLWGSLQALNLYRQGESFDYEWDYSVENKTDTIRNLYTADKKQRGIHFFGNSKDTLSYETLKTHNIEWITIVPFLSQENHDKPSFRTRSRQNDSTPKYQRWRNLKQFSDTYGFKIMLKPHIWLSNTTNGVWRSNIKMSTQAEWDDWFTDYSAYILDYAALAEELNIELFCIGTELHTPAIEQPEQWRTLIKQVRNIYSGKLTYGANWDKEIIDIPFWEDLDFIGVQAYFPIAEHNNPDLEELEQGWKKHFKLLESLHQKYNKPILFTELGYKSTSDAGIKPWEWDTLGNRFYKKISKRTQALCYQAFFNTVWQQSWFEGVHLWEWQSRSRSNGNNNAFTIQNKPALNVVAKGFGKRVEYND